MAFVHPHSTACSKSELDLFTVPPTQMAVDQGFWVDNRPISGVSQNSLEFQIVGTDKYLDLSKTILLLSLKITKANGDDLGDGEKVAPGNNFLHTLYKQVDLFLNGIQVSQSSGTYSYKSLIETILNYGSDAKHSLLTGSLYYKDTAGAMDVTDPTTAGTNDGLKKRYKFTKKSHTVDLFGILHCDMMFSERLLLNNVDVTIKLIPNSSAFCLLSGEASPDYKISIQSAVLKVQTVKISPSLQLLHLKELEKGINAKYPIRRIDCRTYTIPRGNPSLHKDDLFNGQRPQRIVLGMVDSGAFNGSYTKNPYNFKLYGATSIKLNVNGEMTPFQPLNLKLTDTSKTNFMEAYQTLFSGTGRLYADSGVDISRSDYNQGYGLIVFDLTPDLCSSSDHFNQKQKGNVSLDIQFSTGLANAINLIVFGEFESIVEIDFARHVTFDYSA